MPHESVIAPVQLGTFTVTAVVTIVAYKYRDRPGGRSFVGMMAAFSFLSVVGIFMPSHTHWLTSVADTLWSLFPLLWVLFVLNYTGYGYVLNRYTLAALSVVPALSIILVWISLVFPQVLTFVQQSGVFIIIIGWTLTLLAVGILLLLKFALSGNRLYTDQSAALVVGMAGFFGAFSSSFLDIDLFGMNPLFPSIGIIGVAFGFALFRFELFNALPITRQIGRKEVIGDIQEGVFITDTNGQIVDVNGAGGTIVSRSPSSLVGQSVAAVFGDQAPSADDELAPTVYRTEDGRVYDVTVSEIRDRGERQVGKAVVFREITDRKLRETQLEVLNRVLRHNLRNKLNIVQGHAEILSQQTDADIADHAEQQLTTVAQLMALGERAREFEELKTREKVSPQSVDLTAVLDAIGDDLIATFPEATLRTDIPSECAVETYPDVLEIVLENLLRNAAEHAGRSPTVAVTVTASEEAITVAIRDDGPGIPEDELAVLEAETETALKHGSGLGLWITTWGVRYLGGDLAFEVNDPRGTTAVVTLPHTPPEIDSPKSGSPAAVQ